MFCLWFKLKYIMILLIEFIFFNVTIIKYLLFANNSNKAKNKKFNKLYIFCFIK